MQSITHSVKFHCSSVHRNFVQNRSHCIQKCALLCLAFIQHLTFCWNCYPLPNPKVITRRTNVIIGNFFSRLLHSSLFRFSQTRSQRRRSRPLAMVTTVLFHAHCVFCVAVVDIFPRIPDTFIGCCLSIYPPRSYEYLQR